MEMWKNISNSNYDVVRLSKFEVKQEFSYKSLLNRG